MTKVSLKGNY